MKRNGRSTNVSAASSVREKLAETRDHVMDMGHLAKEAVQEKLGKLRDAAAHGVQRGKAQLVGLEEGLEERVRERPIKALLIAAGIGAIVGLVLFRRRD